ncbi:MAG: pectate lyase, partial [Bacteroidaceae bacterium]|nr:pectate lyase [Bacteroidaceae bacterium]
GTIPNIKIDGTSISATDSHIITQILPAGTHEITKDRTFNLFYINLAPIVSGIRLPQMNAANGKAPYYDLQGRQVKNPTKGIYIHQGKKVIRKH